jgi:hypothetical protein
MVYAVTRSHTATAWLPRTRRATEYSPSPQRQSRRRSGPLRIAFQKSGNLPRQFDLATRRPIRIPIPDRCQSLHEFLAQDTSELGSSHQVTQREPDCRPKT